MYDFSWSYRVARRKVDKEKVSKTTQTFNFHKIRKKRLDFLEFVRGVIFSSKLFTKKTVYR